MFIVFVLGYILGIFTKKITRFVNEKFYAWLRRQ